MGVRVLVTIPAYNEAKTIGSLIVEIKKIMNNTNYKYDILVLDDGSRDNTAAVAKKAGAMVFSHPRNYGLAETFKTEMKRALELKPGIIVHIDADNQYLPSEIPKLLKEIEGGYDLVLGSRFKGYIEYMPLVKRLGNILFSKVISSIIRTRISDGQTGFRAFTLEVAEKIQITSNHTYTQEQIIRAVKEKFRVKEVPVYFAKRHGKSKLISNPFGYAIKAGINLMRVYRDYEPLRFFGLVGLLFLFLGFLLGLRLVYYFLLTGQVGHFPTIMLSILFISVGVQILLFGFLADKNR